MVYNDLLNANSALAKLVKEDLSVKEAVRLSRLVKKFEAELKTFNEANEKILNKYGKQNDDGTYNVEQENVEKFNTEFIELISTELENEYDIIEIKSDVSISASDIILLEKFVKFDIDE